MKELIYMKKKINVFQIVMIGKENYEKNKICVKRTPIENYCLNNGVCVVINKELTCPYFFFGDLI